MKKRLASGLVFIACALYPTVSPAQAAAQWSRSVYGPGNAQAFVGNGENITRAMAADPNGNVFISGSTSVGTATAFLTTKVSAEGAIAWQKVFDGPSGNDDDALAVVVDPAGNAIVTGPSFNATGTSDVKVIKYAAADGAVLWQKSFDGGRDDASYVLALDAAGNVLVAADSMNASGNADIRVLKFAGADGALQWQQTFDSGGDEFVGDIAVDGAGNVVIAATLVNAAGNSDYKILKYSAAGALAWQQTFDGGGEDQPYAIALDGSGNAVVTGFSTVSGSVKYRTVKYAAASGAVLWQQVLEGGGSDYAQALAVDSAGNVAVTGQSRNAAGNYDFRTLFYSAASGAVLWDKSFDSGGDDYVYQLVIDAGGAVVVAGSAFVAEGNSDWKVLRYAAADGAILDQYGYAGSAGQRDDAYALAAIPGAVYVSGTSQESGFPIGIRVARLAWSQQASVEPAVPTLIAPSGNVNTATPAYSWNASPGATSYYLLVQNTAEVAVGATYSAASLGCGAGTGTCSVTPSTALRNGTAYNWFVNASNAAGASAWSAAKAISVSGAGPSVPSAPTTISPSGTTTTTTPAYTWNASPGATAYYVLAQNTAGVAVSASYSAASAGCGAGTGTCSVTPSSALANGSVYNWFVNASNSIGTSPWSSARTITVSATGPSVPAAPAPLAPSGTVTTATPAYSWNASSGATSYYLIVQNTAGVAHGASYSAASLGCGAGTGTCSVTPSATLANGTTYNWFVQAANGLGTSPWSAATTITVSASGPALPAAPAQVAPSGTLATRTPTYSWSASPGATSYYLVVQNTAGVAHGASYTAASVGCGAGSGTCSVTPPAALASGATYNWFVNATSSLGTSPWSSGRTISTP